MECVRRLAIVVRPTRRFVDWANGLQAGSRLSLAAARASPSIYLVSTTVERVFGGERYAVEMFENELEAWTEDESQWPPDRTPMLFHEWFEVGLADHVWDLDEDDAYFGDEVPGACGWCGRLLDDGSPVVTITLVRSPDVPPLSPGPLDLPVGGRVVPATVPSRNVESRPGGTGAVILLCSDECASRLRVALGRERHALES